MHNSPRLSAAKKIATPAEKASKKRNAKNESVCRGPVMFWRLNRFCRGRTLEMSDPRHVSMSGLPDHSVVLGGP